MVKLDHAKLTVKDWRAARDWYIKHLGLKLEFEAAAGGPAKLGVAALHDDAGFTLFLEQVAECIPPCGCVHNFQVSDVDAKCRELSASGVRILRAPGKQFWGYGAELADPDGHVLYLWDEKSMREKGGG
ncbi:MAG: VOC family protein [Candidatus Acidiferrales bacterium]